MARIRSIHPGQWTDEDFVELSPMARLLCLALRNDADDNGIFEWKPKAIKMRLLPADNDDVEALLAEMIEHRQVVRYQVGTRSYGAIRNFRKYQSPKKPRAVHPPPERGQVENFDEFNFLPLVTGSPPVPNEGGNPPAEGKGKGEGKGEGDKPNPVPPAAGRPGDGELSAAEKRKRRAAAEKAAKTRALAESAEQVFAHWCKARRKVGAVFRTADGKRHKAVIDRLSDGYTVEHIKLAIDGIEHSPHHRGENPSRTVYDELELICRDGPRLEGLANLTLRARGVSGKGSFRDRAAAYLASEPQEEPVDA